MSNTNPYYVPPADSRSNRATPRPQLSLDDSRLLQALFRRPLQYATLPEYALATGIDTTDIVELFGDALDRGWLSLEIVDDEVFLHTGPAGRPAPADHPDLPQNLWETFRVRANVKFAHALWRLHRSLERAGFAVEADPHRICFGLGPVAEVPFLGVTIANRVVPVLIFPAAEVLADPNGPLTMLASAGAPSVAVVCDQGRLDQVVTGTRRWLLSHPLANTSVLALEAPGYSIIPISAADAAVRGRQVNLQNPTAD